MLQKAREPSHEEEEGLQKKTLTLGGLEDPETPSTSLEAEEAGVVVVVVDGSGGSPDDWGLRNKLSGKEPAIFDGDCSKAKAFILEWTIYMLLNKETEVMNQSFSRTMLFLTYIKGPNVQEWVSMQVAWLGRWVHQGARRTKEYLCDMVMDSFNSAFTDTMSAKKAKAEFQDIKVGGGDLNAYVAKFERLSRLTGYDLQN